MSSPQLRPLAQHTGRARPRIGTRLPCASLPETTLSPFQAGPRGLTENLLKKLRSQSPNATNRLGLDHRSMTVSLASAANETCSSVRENASSERRRPPCAPPLDNERRGSRSIGSRRLAQANQKERGVTLARLKWFTAASQPTAAACRSAVLRHPPRCRPRSRAARMLRSMT